jgi:class 3 adenylate cyclase
LLPFQVPQRDRRGGDRNDSDEVGGRNPRREAAKSPSRRLVTVLFTDIVESTRLVFSLGDRRWLELQAQHETVVRSHLARFGGRHFRSTGDGFVVTFDSAAAAVHAAAAIIESSRPLGLEVRAAVHAGECETHAGRPAGLVFHICSRIMNLARGNEILVSRTIRDVAAGANLAFLERGSHELRGLPGMWELYRASPAPLSTVTLPTSSRRPIALRTRDDHTSIAELRDTPRRPAGAGRRRPRSSLG